MTPQPWTVQVDDSVSVARQMMAEREIHHLPVLDGGRLVGMLSERDLYLLGEWSVPVERAMTIAHSMDTSESLEQVVQTMAEHQWDAVVMTHADRVEGIFTALDALRVLSRLLAQGQSA